MQGTLQCQRCGAHVPVSPELHVLMLRCQYCGLDQPVPDAVARQHALQQQMHSAQIMGHVQQSMKAGMNMSRYIMIGTMVFVLFIFVIVGLSIAGPLLWGSD